MGLNLPFSAFQQWQNQYDQDCGGGPVLKHDLSTQFNIFILGALRKLKKKKNNLACTSFKIEKIKLSLTMPHPRADLLPQMPHPGEDKVVKCLTNTRGGGGGGLCTLGIDRAINVWVITTNKIKYMYQ